MAGETRVSIAALNAAISKYEQKRSDLSTAYLKINDVFTNLESTWKGAASQKMREQFSTMYATLRQTDDRMESAISKLKQAAEIYQATDSEASNMVNSANEGTTPNFF
jgi:WXG100 family type VII secretion target